jgi:hypothetical protein
MTQATMNNPVQAAPVSNEDQTPQRKALSPLVRYVGGSLMLVAGSGLAVAGFVMYLGNRTGWMPTIPFAGTAGLFGGLFLAFYGWEVLKG